VAATASKPPLQDFSASLQSLVRHFDRDATESRRQIRELLDVNREAFYFNALSILKSEGDSRGCQYLVTLFVAYDLLLQALCDPAVNKEQAITLARSATRVDSLTDVSMAKSLAEGSGGEEERISGRDAARLMEVLAEISDGTRILPSLMRLLRHPNPHVRSKAVKMIGRGSRSVRWVRNRLTESDPRVRANAIEALWGLDTDEARELLATAARDGNNRVTGNALLALYRVGDNASIPELMKLAEHESALFRATAAWVMGETGDPRFTETLAGLMRDPNAAVRTRSLSALGRIKAAVAVSRQGEAWLVTGMPQEPGSRTISRRVLVTVARQEGHVLPTLLPTHFLVSENNQMVASYRVLERAVTQAMSVVFVVPRAATPGTSSCSQGVLGCSSRKRPSDLWAVMPYLPGEPGTGAGSVEDAPAFTSNIAGIEAALQRPASRAECTDLWHTLWRSSRGDQGRGKRHLIVLVQSDQFGSAGDGLVSSVIGSLMSVQMIASERCPKIEDFCRRARCSFQVAGSDEEVVRMVELAYLNLLARYEVAWKDAGAEAGPVRVRINSPSGWGEAVIPQAVPAAENG
jgi:hypothetical protein